MAIVSAAVVVAAAVAVSRSSLLDVDRIVIHGAQQSRRVEALADSGLSVGMPMAFLDTDAAESALSSLPWVRAARVRRDWPSTVHIELTAREAVAAVPASHGGYALLDAYGHVVEWMPVPGRGHPLGVSASPSSARRASASGGDERDAMAEPDPVAEDLAQLSSRGLAHISAPFSGELGDVHTGANGALASVAALPDDLRPWVMTVVNGPQGRRLALKLSGGAIAVLGDPVLLDDKMSALRAVLSGSQLDCITEIDLSMPDLTTVVRHESCLL